VFAEKSFAVGSFESILWNKLLRLAIFKRYFFKAFETFLQIKSKSIKGEFFFRKFCGKNYCG